MMGQDAARRAEELLAPLRGERLEHEVYRVLHRRVVTTIDAAVAAAVKERESVVRAECQHAYNLLNERLTKDLYSYAGALGYPIPGDHDGRHSNGTTPQCGLCGPKVAEARREERAKADGLRGLLWQAIRMYDGGGFTGDNVDRWFTGFIFHKNALGDDPNGPPASAPEKEAP